MAWQPSRISGCRSNHLKFLNSFLPKSSSAPIRSILVWKTVSVSAAIVASWCPCERRTWSKAWQWTHLWPGVDLIWQHWKWNMENIFSTVQLSTMSTIIQWIYTSVSIEYTSWKILYHHHIHTLIQSVPPGFFCDCCNHKYWFCSSLSQKLWCYFFMLFFCDKIVRTGKTCNLKKLFCHFCIGWICISVIAKSQFLGGTVQSYKDNTIDLLLSPAPACDCPPLGQIQLLSLEYMAAVTVKSFIQEVIYDFYRLEAIRKDFTMPWRAIYNI